jgi:hypothetical protein
MYLKKSFRELSMGDGNEREEGGRGRRKREKEGLEGGRKR